MTDWLRLGSILEFCAVYFTTQLMRCAAFSFVLIHEKGNMVDDPGKPSRISYVKIMQKGKFILFLAGFISFSVWGRRAWQRAALQTARKRRKQKKYRKRQEMADKKHGRLYARTGKTCSKRGMQSWKYVLISEKWHNPDNQSKASGGNFTCMIQTLRQLWKEAEKEDAGEKPDTKKQVQAGANLDLQA